MLDLLAHNNLPTMIQYCTSLARAVPHYGYTVRIVALHNVSIEYSQTYWAEYRVAQVRTILSLPPHLQRLRPHADEDHSHLAYIELFTPFEDRPEPYSGLYTVSRSYQNMQRKAAIIPVSSIFRSCHLVTDCGDAIEVGWKSETVLEQCEDFFLNAFSDHHMYKFLRNITKNV